MNAPKQSKLGALGLRLSKSPASVQLAWRKEIRRRRSDIRAGRALLIPAEVVLRRLHRMLTRIDRRQSKRTNSPLISTGLQPGERDSKNAKAALAASSRTLKAAKAARRRRSRFNTALKRGANERRKQQGENSPKA